MINHISIGVRNPEHVANVLAELWDGFAFPFPPSPGGYVAFADDSEGTMVEIVPIDVNIVPGVGYPDSDNFSQETVTDEFEATFEPGNDPSLYGSVHLNINSPLDEASIKAIAEREGWRCFTANRGRGIFQLIEVWVENRFLLEVNTPEMARKYREIATPQNWAKFLEMPLPPKYARNAVSLAG